MGLNSALFHNSAITSNIVGGLWESEQRENCVSIHQTTQTEKQPSKFNVLALPLLLFLLPIYRITRI